MDRIQSILRGSFLASALHLSADHMNILAAVARWNSQSFGDMCRMSMIALIEGECGEMEAFASGTCIKRPKQEKAWAQKCLRSAKTSLQQLGWNGFRLADKGGAAK